MKMKILLALTVCAIVVCDFASAYTCITCTNCQSAPTPIVQAEAGSGNCNTVLNFATTDRKTTVTVNREVSTTPCTDSIATALAEDGTATSILCCGAANCNNELKQANVIGCVLCRQGNPNCIAGTDAATYSESSFFKATSPSPTQCKTIISYDDAGKVTMVIREGAMKGGCNIISKPALGTAGDQVTCCDQNGCNNVDYSKAETTSAAPSAAPSAALTAAPTTTMKKGDRIVMNSVLLFSAVIIAML